MNCRSLTLTGEQIRAARAIARIGQAELAGLCGLSLETIKRLEGIRGPVEANVRTIAAIVEAFDRKSVSLELGKDGRVGVRLASGCAAPLISADPVRSTASETERAVYRLIYYSRATRPTLAAMESILSEIQDTSARRNAELGVTGMLMAQNGWFLGALEGDKVAVRQIYGAISGDPRHVNLQVVQARSVRRRQFSDWNVFCGLFSSDEAVFDHEPSMAGGFHAEKLSPAAALGLLAISHDLEGEPPRKGRSGWSRCSLGGRCLDVACVASIRSLSATG